MTIPTGQCNGSNGTGFKRKFKTQISAGIGGLYGGGQQQIINNSTGGLHDHLLIQEKCLS